MASAAGARITFNSASLRASASSPTQLFAPSRFLVEELILDRANARSIVSKARKDLAQIVNDFALDRSGSVLLVETAVDQSDE